MRSPSLPVLAGILLAAAASHAADGVLQINQTCAQLSGCFPGDTPGFPVTISVPGSYRLTGTLTVPDADTDGLFVSADNVTVDLGGFGIQGPTSCTAGGAVVLCAPLGTGIGVTTQASLLGSRADSTTVRNGFVRGMGGAGIQVRKSSHVDGVMVEHCAGGGVLAADGSLVTRSRLILNGTVGLEATSGVVGFEGNRIAEIGGPTVLGAIETGGNTCDDGRCSAVPKRRYYLTTSTHDGLSADNACDPGFHLASIFELTHTASLQYDTDRGLTRGDSGAGPPLLGGWVRTGNVASTSNLFPAHANCDAWSTNSASSNGTELFLELSSSAASVISPWRYGDRTCDTANEVWCMQD